jgi:hypothetical protein
VALVDPKSGRSTFPTWRGSPAPLPGWYRTKHRDCARRFANATEAKATRDEYESICPAEVV